MIWVGEKENGGREGRIGKGGGGCGIRTSDWETGYWTLIFIVGEEMILALRDTSGAGGGKKYDCFSGRGRSIRIRWYLIIG